MIKFGETVNDQDPCLGDPVTNYKQKAFHKNQDHKKSARSEKEQSYSLYSECRKCKDKVR